MPRKEQRIAFLVTRLGYGGAETQLVRLAVGLRELGWAVLVVSIQDPRGFVEELEAEQIPLVSLGVSGGRTLGRGIIEAIRTLRTWRPQVVISFLYHASMIGRLCARITSVPVHISSVRSENLGGWYRNILFRSTHFLDTYITVNSSIAREKLTKRWVLPDSSKVRIIPNGIDTEMFSARDSVSAYRVRSELGVGADEFVWLAIGRLEAPKDYPNLLRAFCSLLSRGRQCHLLIAGNGSLHDMLRRQVDENGLTPYVRLLGLRRDIPDLLQAADALVLSSAWEGMPNVVLEALAAGVPVVATDVGGVREVVRDGVTGYIVPAQDSDALSKAMERMMRLPPETRNRMGHLGRAYVSNQFSIDRVTREWVRLLEEGLQTV